MRVVDKKEWAKEFNIGYEVRGNTRKQKRKTNYDDVNDIFDIGPLNFYDHIFTPIRWLV